MAQRVVTHLVSDLSGDEMAEGKGETIAFSFRGTNYSIDLTDKEAAGSEKSIRMYLEHATRLGRAARGTAKKSSATSSSADNRAIREWAGANGYEIGDRGRIPSEIREAYAAS